MTAKKDKDKGRTAVPVTARRIATNTEENEQEGEAEGSRGES